MNLSSKFWSALFIVISLTPTAALGARFGIEGDSNCTAGTSKSGEQFPDAVELEVHPDCKPGLKACLPEALDGGEIMFRLLLLPPS
mmetsp:Transcript_40408/g.93768  ORF Transcript_40408/g.93768 Transcript_40408/m.93768 type:complete len:86 (-) Transcript_40408:1397-1654(-)